MEDETVPTSVLRTQLASLRIPQEDIVNATNNFADENLIKRGGISDVYKGLLFRSTGSIKVVVRRFHPSTLPLMDERSILREIRTLSYKRRNHVSVVGFCDENGEMMIIMEQAVNGSLDRYLSDPTLTWSQRLKICLGAALGLEDVLKTFGRYCEHDIKSSRILLDKDWESMLFCFGSCISNRVVFYKTTIYTDPDLIKTGCSWSRNPDVYSLGVILFEVLCGKKAEAPIEEETMVSMVKHGNLEDMIDPNLRKQMHPQSLFIFSKTAYNCLKKSDERPDMNQIVKQLREALVVNSVEEILEEDFGYLKIPLGDIKLATNNFAKTYFIGLQRGGMMYKAELDHFDHKTLLTTEGKKKGALPKTRSTVIIKCIHGRVEKRFLAEIKMLASCKNPNIVSLLGFSWDDCEKILIYECPSTSLHEYLRSTSQSTNLVWEQRIRIGLDIVHGLKYLFNNIQHGAFHQMILSDNVFLDNKRNAKIANFRHSTDESRSNIGYSNVYYLHSKNSKNDELLSSKGLSSPTLLDDELFDKMLWAESKRMLSKKSDDMLKTESDDMLKSESDNIYSIGVILFEMLTGNLAYDLVYISENVKGLGPIARRKYDERNLKDIVDPRIMEEVQVMFGRIFTQRKGPKRDSLDTFSNIAYKCLAEDPSDRPTLEDVIESLEKALQYQVQTFEHLKIQLQDIELATGNFDEKCCIGWGGYGAVYKAELYHFDVRSSLATYVENKNELPKKQSTVAIKRIFGRDDNLGSEGFLTELEVLSRCKHPNIVSLVGFCVEGLEMILVYELASNGSLDNYLEKNAKETNISWAQRLNICIDIAEGMYFLHTTFMKDNKRIIHRDIKSANILLGENWEAKLADFGLSKVHFANQQGSTINTNVAGTKVYADPEYLKTNKLKKESDIYSFGVVLFEILSGTVAYHSNYMNESIMGLAPVVRRRIEEGTLNEIIDSEIMDEAHILGATLQVGPDKKSLDTFINIAHQCLAETQSERPPIQTVIVELKKALEFQENRKYPYTISHVDIKLSTEGVDDNNYIVRGGFGTIYNGQVQDEIGQKNVLVKRFSRCGHQHGLLREFEVLLKNKHENIIGLVGYCNDKDEEMIVYEHAANGSLDRHLKDPSVRWTQRLKICIDIAKGLNFLHGGDTQKHVVIHRDIKSSNILLTHDWKAKICGFELSLIAAVTQEIDYVINDVVGTPGYCDPVYWETGFLTKESDIYSFGVVLFEILCGRMACPVDFRNQSQLLDNLVQRQYAVGRLDEIVFEGIQGQIALKSLATFRRIAYQCLHGERNKRPTTHEIIVQLQNALEFQEDYEVWDLKLPRNYKEILDQLSKSREIESMQKKKDIYNILSKGILLEEGKIWFSIGSNGERNEMISAKMFSYKNRWSHKWRSIQGSRFKKVAEMSNVRNLKIQIKIRPQLLPPDVDYRAFLVFKFCGPRISHTKQMYVNLKYKVGFEDLHSYFATWRDDNWMQIELYRFSNQTVDSNFEVFLECFSRCYCDSCAIYIEGIEFRVIDQVKEKTKKFEETQQVLPPNVEMDKVGFSPGEMKSKRLEVPAKHVLYNLSNGKPPQLYPSSQSRTGGVIELPRHQVFSIKWKIERKKVIPMTEYLCYLVFKLSENCSGLHCPMIVRDQFSRESKTIVYFRSPSPWNLHDTDQVPKKRSDGWMEVIVWKFNINYELKKYFLPLHLKLISYQGTMSGLVVRSIEFETG